MVETLGCLSRPLTETMVESKILHFNKRQILKITLSFRSSKLNFFNTKKHVHIYCNVWAAKIAKLIMCSIEGWKCFNLNKTHVFENGHIYLQRLTCKQNLLASREEINMFIYDVNKNA